MVAGEHRMPQELAAKFVDRGSIPPVVPEREADGGTYAPTERKVPLLARCRELDLWGLDGPPGGRARECWPSGARRSRRLSP